MGKMTITRQHSLNDEQLKTQLDKLSTNMKEKYGVLSTWKTDKLVEIKASGVSGQITLTDQKVSITLKFNMMMSMFAGKIEKDIESYLDKHFS